MSEPQTVDLKGEFVEHLHLLSSDEAGWNGLNLIYEREPAGEAPETWLGRHLLVICLGALFGRTIGLKAVGSTRIIRAAIW